MKYILVGLGAVLLIGALVLVVILRPMTPKTTQDTQSSTAVDTPALAESNTDKPATLANGRYENYSSSLVRDTGYQTTILFFYAGWCPECRGYDQVINTATIPDGVQILKVSYDDEQTLRKQYGVTIQSSFVRVNAAGDRQTLWNGYGKEKSLDVILENTK